MEKTDIAELVPGLPDDLGLECLTRLPYSAHPGAIRVCRRWRHLLESDDFYYQRKKLGHTRELACLVQALPAENGEKPTGSPRYGVTVFDRVSQSWERLDPIPEYPFGLPLFCQSASCEGKLVVMGGWDPATYEPVTKVFVYDFRTSQWRRGKDMPSRRSFFAIGAFQGRVYIAGGHDENKNALRTAWVYDVRRDQWTELNPMSQERDECEGMVVGDEFWVVSGYATERQGMFEGSADVYDFGSGQWRRVEGVWKAGQCPRSCVGIHEKDGKMMSWGELDPGVRVGVCGVTLGSRALVGGAEYQEAPHRFYMVEILENHEGQKCKLTRVSVSDEFSGFVQSGCCVEI
ncbi:hypothetical protein L6164_025349 [Bauhinia variegata]|uniref:Uncharacterized protein n=2 Tax=Bauhinia variegata TaxID=167791 RepID=A0ACB9M0M1_BAUVA|nr:hypothetical protein L6164_025349 [Bauhinia variegata]